MRQDEGPFYHGTTASLEIGDFLTPGFPSNYRSEVIMNHIYFTALKDGAGMAAELAVLLRGEDSEPHVYLVEPQGDFENDPNVTDKKFPGNPTRSYRTDAPLKILQEVDDWTRMSPESIAIWAERLANLKNSNAEIIN
jgi:rifampin ADP-ribosylating transferase